MGLKVTFSINRNNLLYELICNYSYLCPVIAHFGRIFFFMRPSIIKRRRIFVYPSLNQSVYTFTLKQRGLQLRNLVYIHSMVCKLSYRIPTPFFLPMFIIVCCCKKVLFNSYKFTFVKKLVIAQID